MRYWSIGVIGGILLATPLMTRAQAEQRAAESKADPLSGLSTQRVSLELKQITAKNLFRIFEEIGQKEFRLDSCILDRKVDVKFQNAPLRLVVDAVGLQLGLAYRDEGLWISVSCQ